MASIAKEVKEFHQFLKDYWNKKNKISQFDDVFNAAFDEHDPEYVTGDSVCFDIDIRITNDEIKLLQMFCKKYNCDFSIAPLPSAQICFQIQDFTQQPILD